MHACMHACIHTYIHTHTHIHAHVTYTYTYTYTIHKLHTLLIYTHTHIYMYWRINFLLSVVDLVFLQQLLGDVLGCLFKRGSATRGWAWRKLLSRPPTLWSAAAYYKVKFDSSITALLLQLLYAESWRIYQHFKCVYVQLHVCADVMFMLRIQGM